MITIVAKVSLRDGKKAEFIAAVQDMITGSRAEDGNISYDLFEDADNENCLAFIEQWKDIEAIKLHNESTHYKNGKAAIASLVEGMEVTKYKML